MNVLHRPVEITTQSGQSQAKESPDWRGSLNHQYYLDQAFLRREKPIPASPKPNRARVAGSGT